MELLYPCLRVIAHDILCTMEGRPEDFILNCFGEQFADAKKLGLKTPAGCKLKSQTRTTCRTSWRSSHSTTSRRTWPIT
eukprot:6184088-Pleurochrysis_carterae.AAC.2